MPAKLPSATCANCDAIMHEGERALHDAATDRYFCGEDCFAEWYAENLAKYKRDNVAEVDI